MTKIPDDSSPLPAPDAVATVEPTVLRPMRFWPVIFLLGAYWGYSVLSEHVEMATHVRFFARIGASLLVALGFAIWWFLNRRFSRGERFAWFVCTLAVLAAAGSLSDRSVGVWGLLFFGIPCVITVATAWLLVARRLSLAQQRRGLATVIVLVPASFTLVRIDGLSGEQQSHIRWRWKPAAEELYLLERAHARTGSTGQNSSDDDSFEKNFVSLQLQPDDWPRFRGPLGNGEVRGLEIATDWKAAPPRLVWRQRIGPAWSSMVVFGKWLFTQEQRGESETVVCLDAETGREIWARDDAVRFWEPVSGTGPRATPAYADGHVYTLGAKGLVNCFDAFTGSRIWSHDISQDAGAPLPQWAFSGSPLVSGDLVIVFAGGPGEKQLLAYRATTGSPAWSVAAGQLSYSSPQLAAIDGTPQILLLNDRGLTAVSAESGAPLWEFSAPIPGAPRSVEAAFMGPSHVLVATEAGIGMVLLTIDHAGGKWNVTAGETSNQFKPAFSDFVVYNGCVYGFDSAIFACVDCDTGKRCWKQGRYGHGQVLLLTEQGLLLVLAETGEVVLLKASPDRHKELGRFQAIEGKTWNHPAIAHGRLYVRNAEEIACYELAKP